MVAIVSVAVAVASRGPERIALPDGFRPEGIAAQSSEGVLWRIDPATGSHAPVDLHRAELTKHFRSGRVVHTITHPDFDVPTTVAHQRGSLYLPNARFTTPPTPETDYWVTRVSKH